MDSPELPLPPERPAADSTTSNVTLESLQAANQALRNQLHLSMLAGLLLSGALFVFLLREISLVRKQTQEFSREAADYQRNVEPFIRRMQVQFDAFAKTHPDFRPVYQKYFGATNAPPVAPAPALPPTTVAPAPKPAVPSAPKK